MKYTVMHCEKIVSVINYEYNEKTGFVEKILISFKFLSESHLERKRSFLNVPSFMALSSGLLYCRLYIPVCSILWPIACNMQDYT
jgi:hypothetical protein